MKLGRRQATDVDRDFDAFAAALRPSLVRTAVVLLSSRSDAEDAAQDALVAVASRWHELERPEAYAHSCVLNACRMQLRRRQLAARHPSPVSPAVDMPAPLVELHGSLQRLSEDQRAAIVLRYLLDLPESDIAEVLGCRPSTVRSHIRRGLSRLRTELS